MVLLYFFVFIGGLMIGSFINVVVHRLKTQEKIFPGRSHCPKCKKQISWYDNIPILSFILLRGRCRHCHKKISWEYPLVELACGSLFLFNALVILGNQNLLTLNAIALFDLGASFIFTGFFIIIFLYDLKYYLILDQLSIPLIIFALIINLFNYSLKNLIIGGIIGLGFFALQYFLSKGQWIGEGDLRLGLAIGFILGFPKVFLGIGLAYFLGSIIAVILLATRKKSLTSKIPFGPFIVLATYLIFLFGDFIINKYFRF